MMDATDDTDVVAKSWAINTLRWMPKQKTRLRGRPKRWRDELDRFMTNWKTAADNGEKWKEVKAVGYQRLNNNSNNTLRMGYFKILNI